MSGTRPVSKDARLNKAQSPPPRRSKFIEEVAVSDLQGAQRSPSAANRKEGIRRETPLYLVLGHIDLKNPLDRYFNRVVRMKNQSHSFKL